MFLEAATDTATNQVASIDWNAVLDTVINWCTTTGIKILIALVVMFITFKVINFITKKLYKHLQKKQVDATISKVSTSFLRLALKVVILICIVGYLGFETASLSAVVASLGVGISLAVQGTLSNFAGGVIIILMRPFRIGDFITSNGESGTVEDIKLFYTHIITVDNKMVSIPNGSLANNVIVNASAKETRRVDVVMSVAYGTDLKLAKSLIYSVFERNELILKDPAPFSEVSTLAASSIDFTVRAWVNSGDYWTVYYYLLNEIMVEFEKNNIEIPFNQLDVNIKNQ